MSLKGINPLALLVLVSVIVLTFMNKLTPEAFLTFVSGLAIPARQDGYQSLGTQPTTGTPDKPLVVEGTPGGQPVPTTEAPPGSQAPLLDVP